MEKKNNTRFKKVIGLGLLLVVLGFFAIISLGEKVEETPVIYLSEPKQEVAMQTNDPLRDQINTHAMGLLGVPYVYAGTSSEGFDCSGFVYYVFKKFSIEVPRSTSLYGEVGQEIPIESVQKGDLLLFLSPTRNEIGHIGIVTNPKGMETEFIHATSGKEMSVTLSTLKQPNYNRRFVRAISILNE